MTMKMLLELAILTLSSASLVPSDFGNTFCLRSEHVQNGACVPCTNNQSRPIFDDTTAGDTECFDVCSPETGGLKPDGSCKIYSGDLDVYDMGTSYTSNLQYVYRLFIGFEAKMVNGSIVDGDPAKQVISVQFPELLMVEDKLYFENRNLTSVSFPKLRAVGFDLHVGSTSLPSVSFPELEVVGGHCEFFYRAAASGSVLKTASAPKLRRVKGFLDLAPASCTSVDLSSLEELNEALLVSRADSLTTLALPKLASVDGIVRIESNLKLTSFSAPLLTRASGGLKIGFNPELTTVSMPKLASIGEPPLGGGDNFLDMCTMCSKSGNDCSFPALTYCVNPTDKPGPGPTGPPEQPTSSAVRAAAGLASVAIAAFLF